jgi:16S rRNA (cytosine1402-N4)-methyltransferase
MEFSHISVLPKESVSMLNINPKGIYVDGTLGGGGHSALICSELSDEGRLVGIDRDDAAIAAATARLKNFKCKVTLCRDNFFNVKSVIADLGIDAIDGAVLDLGVSSPQLDVPERGFSYNSCARLDMRMDRRAELDAYTVVNTYDEKRLADIIFKYVSDLSATIGLRFTKLTVGSFPQTQTGKSLGQIHPFARSANARLTILSSSE